MVRRGDPVRPATSPLCMWFGSDITGPLLVESTLSSGPLQGSPVGTPRCPAARRPLSDVVPRDVRGVDLRHHALRPLVGVEGGVQVEVGRRRSEYRACHRLHRPVAPTKTHGPDGLPPYRVVVVGD